MLGLEEAYSMMVPSEPSRGASTRMVHDETERLRVAQPPAQPIPVAPQPMQQSFSQPAARKAVPAPAGDKARETRKILLYALIVLLGLAMHHVSSDWLAKYLSTAYLSDNSEQIAKLCYPASVAAGIWILRSWK